MNQETQPQLLLHPQTQTNIEKLGLQPRQSILLTGQPYLGKRALASQIARNIVGPTYKSQLLEINPNQSGNISIDSIKELRGFIQFVSTGSEDRRVVLINDAHSMSLEAQNSFLKLLEEPPNDVLIILLAWQPQLLLETIRSRVVEIEVKKPTLSQTRDYFNQHQKSDIDKFYLMSGGSPALIDQLLKDSNHEYLDDINYAKSLLQKPAYDRLLLINELAKDKVYLDRILLALAQILSVALKTTAGKNQSISGIMDKLELVVQTRWAIRKNHNTKLNLTLLFTRL